MDATSSFTISTFVWLTVQAIPLLFTPSMLLPLLTAQENPATGPTTPPIAPSTGSLQATELSTYLARSVGITQIALAAVSLLLSGFLPLSTLANTDPSVAAAYATPTVFIITLFHFASTFHCYTTYQSLALQGGGTAYLLGAVGSGFLAAMGVWVGMFGSTGGHVSRRTGKDKRTSGWPFGDKKGRKEILKET